MSWPGFFSLSSAWLALALIPLVVFYFLKLKRPRQEVPSLVLWYQVINDQRVNSPFQKFKRNLLLLLQVLVLTCLVLAAMQPYVRRSAQHAQFQPILIDCSASMGALDQPRGTTRLAAAKAKVETIIDNLLPDQQVSLIAFHGTARRLTDFTDNKRILKEALTKLEVVPVGSQTIDALRMAQALARTVPIERVLLISDGNIPPGADFELPFDLVFEQIPPGGTNIGITAFNARRSGARKWDIFVSVDSAGDAENAGTLELLQNGKSAGREQVSIVPGRTRRVVFRLETDSAADLEARLTPDSFDSLGADNVAYLHLPKSRPLSLFVPPSLPAFRKALQVLKGIDLNDDKKLAIPGASYDLVVSDRLDDAKLEASVAFLVGVVPKDLEKLISVAKGAIDVVDWDRSAALLQHVQLADVTAIDQPRSAEGVRDGDFEKLGYDILAFGRTGPLILEKRIGNRVEDYLMFHTDRSTLPYRVAFPILASNLVEMARVQSGLAEVRGGRTGVLPPLALKPQTAYRVTGPSGAAVTSTSNESGVLNGVSAPTIGQYTVADGATEVARVGVSLLDVSETGLKAIKQIQFRENIQVAASQGRIDPDTPLWPTLSVIGLGLLMAEWWYFQRRPGGPAT